MTQTHTHPYPLKFTQTKKTATCTKTMHAFGHKRKVYTYWNICLAVILTDKQIRIEETFS